MCKRNSEGDTNRQSDSVGEQGKRGSLNSKTGEEKKKSENMKKRVNVTWP